MNKNIKTLFALLAALALVFAAGCDTTGGSDDDEQNTEADGGTGEGDGKVEIPEGADVCSGSADYDLPDLSENSNGYTVDTDTGAYLVYTAAGLKAWADHVNNGNYDVSCTLYACIDISSETWTPVGTSSNPYTGAFDGGGHVISNLAISGSDYTGFFCYIGEGGIVQNLNLKEVSITGNGNSTGGIAGRIEKAEIADCTVTGNVTGNTYTGGIVGTAASGSTITGCSSSANVTGSNSHAGGIAGYVYGEITGCYSSGGTVTATGGYAGGIAGQTWGAASITACYSTANVSGGQSAVLGGNVGGIVGNTQAKATITGCYYFGGTVSGNGSGDSYVGAIAGYNNASATITNCYWSSSSISSGIGINANTSSNTTKVTGNDWSDAMKAMNSAITDSGWQYESGSGNEPLVLKKS